MECVKSNIENPRYILQNVKPSEDGSIELVVDHTKQDYIDFIPVEGKIKVIKTIVSFSDIDEGHIVTSHVLRNINEIKLKGGVIYDSKNKSNTKFISI